MTSQGTDSTGSLALPRGLWVPSWRTAGALLPLVMAAAWCAMWARYYSATHYFTLATRIQDDSYYYLLPAWNYVRLGWFTFDGITQTYGFQPLWELVLVCLARATPTREIFFRGALLLGVVLYAATAIVTAGVARAVWRSINPRGGTIAACAAAAMLLLNLPVAVANASGKENALYGLLLSCLLLLRLRPTDGKVATTAVAAGGLAGLILLTRLSPMSLAVVLLPTLPSADAGRRRFATLYALTALLTLLPWVLYAYSTFGSAFPMSGRVKLYGAVEHLLSARSNFSAFPSAIADYVGECVRFSMGYPSKLWPDQAPFQSRHRLPFLLLTAAGLLWLLRTRQRYLLTLAIGVLLAHATLPVLLYLRETEIYYARWYVVELPILLAIAAGVGAEMLNPWLRRPWHRFAPAGMLLIAIAIYPSVLDAITPARPISDYTDRGDWQQVLLRVALDGDHDFSPGDRIGAFSSGLLGWFSAVPVVNLDGLANDEMLPLWRAPRYCEPYCLRRGITVYIDATPPQELFTNFTLVRTKTMTAAGKQTPYFIARLPRARP